MNSNSSIAIEIAQPPESCAALASAPRILNRMTEELRTRGLIGEERGAKLLYLVLTSRFLPRPVSAVVKGPSSAGKSHLVEQVLSLFPLDAYYKLTAMSERVLAYTKEPLSHRFIILGEAAALRGEMLAYLIRSLLSEGRIDYEVVERMGDSFGTRKMRNEGPTGLLVTTTALRLHLENETRLFSIPINDTPEQTRAIMIAMAQFSEKSDADHQWVALQSWLAKADHQVVIPYAKSLAERTSPVAVRLRRDFKAVLNLVKSHTLLHQLNRERDSEGRVIATLEDYAEVRELVVALFSEGVGASISPTVRETVTASAKLGAHRYSKIRCESEEGPNILAVAKELRIDASAAWRRVREAIRLGYLINLEDRKSRPARLALGEPLPEEEFGLLPQAEELQSVEQLARTQPYELCGRGIR
jgi:hypothetical protein